MIIRRDVTHTHPKPGKILAIILSIDTQIHGFWKEMMWVEMFQLDQQQNGTEGEPHLNSLLRNLQVLTRLVSL